jgi:Cytochrome c554 and c-prime
MRFKIIFSFVFICLVFSGLAISADHKYVGVATCKMCHKAQFEVWGTTLHSKAMETLKSPEAQKIAQQKGLKTSAAESPQCTKCHETAADAPPAMLDAKFDKTMGVQCETCHGAGSDYKSMTVMKDHAKAVEAGMAPIKVADGSAEKQCVQCHNSESPTFKDFKFQSFWEKIKHPKKA